MAHSRVSPLSSLQSRPPEIPSPFVEAVKNPPPPLPCLSANANTLIFRFLWRKIPLIATPSQALSNTECDFLMYSSYVRNQMCPIQVKTYRWFPS